MRSACRPLTAWRRLAAPSCAAVLLVLLVPGPAVAGPCAGLSLVTGASGATGATPSAVAVGDFDRNGTLDVAAANGGASSFTVLLGDGLGGLVPLATTGSAASPVDIATGDLDRDGVLDLVVASGSAAQVLAHRGLPGGSFVTGVSFNVGVVPTRIALADFNRDGLLDLVVVSQSSHSVRVFQGLGTMSFGAALASIDLSASTPAPVAVAAADLDGDGDLDLAVALASTNQVAVFLGNGTGALAAGPTITVGASPRDVFVGDVNRDGRPDLVTANAGSANVSVLLGSGGGNFTLQSTVSVPGATPARVALVDLDRDGALDLAVLDETPSTPRLLAFEGNATPALFDPTPYAAILPGPSVARGLALGDFTSDGHVDLVTALSATGKAVVVDNASGTNCTRTSFGSAPRVFSAGDGPVSVAVADYDEDGRSDMVVASATDGKIQFLRATGSGFALPFPYSPSLAARGVATADFDFDGHADVVAALGSAGQGKVQILRGDGTGAFTFGASQNAGVNTAAVAVGDFDGNGTPDVAAVSENDGGVWVFLGDGAGGLSPAPGSPIRLGMNGPRALVVADLTGDGKPDLAVAASGGSTVEIFRNAGGGTFTAMGTLNVGTNPWGIAAADLNLDGKTDLVTADNGSAQVSVLLGTGAGAFAPAVAYPVDGAPTSVAALDLTGTSLPDVAVTSAGTASVNLLENLGAGVLGNRTVHPVRGSPQSIATIDADSDGRTDLAVPCRSADAVVVLLGRPPGPPAFSAAVRVPVGTRPRDAVAVDLDGDGDLDLAVANETDSTVTLLRNDGAGGFTAYLTRPVGLGPVSIVAGDFNRDGRVDLALNAPGEVTKGVSILLAGGSPGSFPTLTVVPTGTTPDALVAGDFDRDGDLDLAVCDLVPAGSVRILRNDGNGNFTESSSVAVGNKPTAIVAVDFDRDGKLDLAVANDDSNDVSILRGNGDGTFTLQGSLALVGGDTSPVALAAGDFDGDGDADLAAASFDGDRLSVFRNLGGLSFAAPVGFASPNLLSAVVAADLNLDGRPDLATAAGGLNAFRGRGGLDFDPPDGWVTALTPWSLAVGDFNRDGLPDAAVVNDSSDVSILLSTACGARRLDVSLQPSACGTGQPPYAVPLTVQVFDDGGNPATCATGTVTAAIVPGTGDPGATLAGTTSLALAGGAASFTGSSEMQVTKAGRRYQLQLSTPGLPPAVTRRFTLGAELAILGTPSVCPSSSAVFGTEGSYDQYVWTLDSPPAFAFTPTATLLQPPVLLGPHTLQVQTRVDGCSATRTLGVYAGNLQSTSIAIQGLDTVCVDCIGGTLKAVDVGGGPAASRQWGYRKTSGVGQPVTSMPGETGETYVLKGASFPGPGVYYVVVSTNPTCGTANTISSERAVTVVAPVPGGEVQSLGASTGGPAGSGAVLLQWVNSTGTADEIRVRWNKAPDGTSACLPPLDPFVAASGQVSFMSPTAGVKGSFPHTGLALDTAYCYSVFVDVAGTWSPGRTVKARPFDAGAGPVKWAYSTGATAVVPPVVGKFGILVVSNDRTIHSLTRGGAAGGVWPASWVPRGLTGVAHSRSPIVPFGPGSLVFAGGTVFFTADDAGDAHAFDAETGTPKWVPPSTPSAAASITGAPGAILQQYGGPRDLALVGTRNGSPASPSSFFGLDLGTGATVDSWDGGGTMGPVSGTPAVDYGTPQRVYFASRKLLGAGNTVWALNVNAGSPAFTSAWSRDYGEFDTSPVLRNGRLYLGSTDGLVHSLRASDGLDPRTFTPTPADGPVKGFVFPDRRNDDILFATGTKVWSVSDDGTPGMTKNWEWTAGVNLSVVLYWPETNYAYVGGSDGRLYQLDFSAATASTPPVATPLVLGDGTGQIGAPSLDIGIDLGGGKRLLVVGSESGTVYGVAVPY